jgi:hypothetical protein
MKTMIIKDKRLKTYNLAIPALLTAEATALMAVSNAFKRVVNSPVASFAFRCSPKTKRVKVMQFVSICVDIIIAININIINDFILNSIQSIFY